MILLIRRALAALLLLAAALAGAHAQGLQPVPALSARVIDQAGTLGLAQRARLEDKLARFEEIKGTQIVILMVPTTQPEDIAAYANRVGNAWKIGRKGVGDGILIVVARNDRKMRIEVAKTLEGAVPDIAAARVIDETMAPRFREGDFAGGLDAAIVQLVALINGQPLPAVKTTRGKAKSGMSFLESVILTAAVLSGLWLLMKFLDMGMPQEPPRTATESLAHDRANGRRPGKKRRRKSGGSNSSSDYSYSSDSYSSSYSSDSYSSDSYSGSFSSGGGGDFGGGGASGDW
jgi:uncharacterized protein